jgi:lipoprotein signal peptidase
MLNLNNRKSLSYKIGIFLPALIVTLINLYAIISQSPSKYTPIITDILIIFMFFNLGIREIILYKHKIGCYFLLIVVVIMVLLYRHNMSN